MPAYMQCITFGGSGKGKEFWSRLESRMLPFQSQVNHIGHLSHAWHAGILPEWRWKWLPGNTHTHHEFELGWLLEFYVLATSTVILGALPTCDSACSVQTLYCCPTGKSGHWHHDPLSHSVTLSWDWANQSLPYPINADRQARKRQISVLLFIDLTWLGIKLPIFPAQFGHYSATAPNESSNYSMTSLINYLNISTTSLYW